MRHDSYLPSSPATLQALDRMEYAMVNAITPPDVRIVGPHFNVSSHSPVSLDTYKNLTPGFFLLSNYLLLSSDPLLLLPFIPPPPPRHDWDDECYLHLATSIVGLADPSFPFFFFFFLSLAISSTPLSSRVARP